MIRRVHTCIAGISLVIILTTANGHADTSYGACITPSDKSGHCIELSRCNEIDALLKKPFKLPDDIQYLRSSECGVHNGNILVCCSDEQPPQPTKLPSPAKRECGRVFQERILGGKKTKLHEFPWMALLEYRKNGQSIGHKCGGSLIHERYILTAAHCVSNLKPYRVRLGEWDTTTDIDCVINKRGIRTCAEPHIDVDVEQIIKHPRYQRWSINQHFDIALLRLKRDVALTFYIHPICMPPKTTIQDDATPGVIMDVAGWGKTENSTKSVQKLKLEIAVVSNEDCQKVYGRKVELISSQLCAGGVKGQDSCSGDSGGPLMALDVVNNKEYAYLAGVVSYGHKPCGSEGWPSVYTKVSEFHDWILENMTP